MPDVTISFTDAQWTRVVAASTSIKKAGEAGDVDATYLSAKLKAVQAHERYHWRDQMKWFVIPWFIIYVSLLPFYGGFRKHPFERPAYAVQDKVNASKNKKDS